MSSIPNCLVWRHSEACSPFSWCPATKTKQQNGARSDSFFPSKAKNGIPQWQWKATHLQHLCGLRGQHIRILKGSTRTCLFTEVIVGQSTASVLKLMSRSRTVWRCPRCWSQTACHLCFIRSPKIHWLSSIAQKGSISKPCLLRLGPGPLSVGKVSVAFVQVHGTQTAARQRQAADLYSRLQPSMAAPAQTQQRFG